MRSFVAFLALAIGSSIARADTLQTVAEKTDYAATSRYADVVAFCEAVAKRGPAAKLSDFGASVEGRKLPLLVIADPPIATPEAARQSGKLVVLAFANIHAGEVDGKEALLALARELTDKPGHPLLKDLVILLVPILNADGNERIDPRNRPGDKGPSQGAGIRENAQEYDLNRDFVKLESNEIRALVKLINQWDPAVIIDCHTTNGSKHRHTLTYDGPRYLCEPLENWALKTLFPAVIKRVKETNGYDLAPYGNFSQDRAKWETYPASPRFGVQYFALRQRIGILSESYSYASFKDRVLATLAFVKACFETATAEKETIRKLIARDSGDAKRVTLKTSTISYKDKLLILGYVEELKNGRRVPTEQHKTYELEWNGQVKPELSVKQPFAYLVPAKYSEAIATLRRHSIALEELREDVMLEVEAYQITEVQTAARAFQKHKLVTADARIALAKRMIPAGTVLVKTDQPLGTLAAYLLEPQAEDGLTTWGLFQDGAAAGKEFPVLRLPRAYPLMLGAVALPPGDEDGGQPLAAASGRSAGFAGAPQGRRQAGSLGQWLDGEHFLQEKEGKLWKCEARTGKVEPFVDPEAVKKSLSALKEVTASTAERIARGASFRFNPDHTGFLFDIDDDLGFAYLDGRPAVRLTRSDGARQDVTISPTGKAIAFTRNGNLFAASVEKPGEQQLTFDGGGDILNAHGDWVYEEEIFNRRGKAFWWSADGERLAYLRFDDAPVKKYDLLNLSQLRQQLNVSSYPLPGDANPHVRIGVASISGGKPTYLDFGDYPVDAVVVSRVGWMPDSRVFAYVQNRTQTWLDFVVWDTPSAKPRKLFRETTRAWVEDMGQPHFLPDGSFLLTSERTGWKQIYHFAADGKLIAPVTRGDWEVHAIARVDAEDNCVYFSAAMTSPTSLDFCRASLGGGPVELLTEKDQYHRVTPAPHGRLFIDRMSNVKTPPQTVLEEAGAGVIRKLETNPARERDPGRQGRVERARIAMKDGFELEAAITYPPDFNAAKKYPIWILTYAGPHAPTIRDEWEGGRGGMDGALAASGIVVFRVDPRSASGKGAQSAWACYKQLGVQELKDLEEAVSWLCQKPWADASRVGISGHSYGGFMAAFALTHSKVFAAGIASGPVTDWKLYDSIYTERYMLTPKENPEGYAKSSCVAAAKNLHGKLLIMHGMMDDNVHMQNSVQLVDALQRANKDFELMFYPQARHGLGGPHYSKTQLDFIKRTMGVAK